METPTGPHRDESGGEVLHFVEDRGDIARRALPRLAVGTAGWCLVGAVVAILAWGSVPGALGIAGGLWVLAMLTRFDVWALQLGRPIRYELHEDYFVAYRGTKVATTFRYADVEEWTAASSASTFDYWIGWGLWRSGGFTSVLSTYSFTMPTERGKRKKVEPPALFRWQDRGGLEDVTHALIDRLGTPLNYPIDYAYTSARDGLRAASDPGTRRPARRRPRR